MNDLKDIVSEYVQLRKSGLTGKAALGKLRPFIERLSNSPYAARRWNVEPYHKSLKQNASLSKSPTKTVTTQSNHIFASICAYIKLEMLKVSTQTNHFALKSKLYMRALRTAFEFGFPAPPGQASLHERR